MLTTDQILCYYRDEVVNAVTIAQTLEGNFPREVLNEIRSAFTHLARSSNPGLSKEEKIEERQSSLNHLKRVCLDCYKISILNRAEELERLAIAIVDDNTVLPNHVYSQRDELRKRRLSCGIKEGQDPPNGTVGELKTLLNDFDSFVLKVETDFGGKAALARQKSRKWKIFGGLLAAFSLGLFVNYLTDFTGNPITWAWTQMKLRFSL